MLKFIWNSLRGQLDTPKTIYIYQPEQSPELDCLQFATEADFQRFMACVPLSVLFKDGKEPAIVSFKLLENQAVYTFSMTDLPRLVRDAEGRLHNLDSRFQDELASELALSSGNSAVTIRHDLQLIKDATGNQIALLDAVVECNDTYYLGCHETSVASDDAIKRLKAKMETVVVQIPEFGNKRVQPVLMTEYVKNRVKPQIVETAKRLNVHIYQRIGSSISRVQCRAMKYRAA